MKFGMYLMGYLKESQKDDQGGADLGFLVKWGALDCESTGLQGRGFEPRSWDATCPSPWDIKWRWVVSSVLCWGN